jgi:nicotinamide mononucleotide (NMN) deamidase PncC
LFNTIAESDDDQTWPKLLDRLHTSDFQIAIVISGGGSGSLAKCFRHPGASKTFVEAVIAYSRASMTEYLGEAPVGTSASADTARQLSLAAIDRCTRLSDAEEFTPVGIAIVAALPTSVPRKGADRIHVAMTVNGTTQTWASELPKGEFTRESAEDAADRMLSDALTQLLIV